MAFHFGLWGIVGSLIIVAAVASRLPGDALVFILHLAKREPIRTPADPQV